MEQEQHNQEGISSDKPAINEKEVFNLKRKLLSILFIFFSFFVCNLAPVFGQTTSSSVKQIIIVSVKNIHTHYATLAGYTVIGKRWIKTYPTVPAVIGFNGVTWNKREGDGKTPLGTYPLLYAFGYYPNKITKMPYRQSTSQDFFVDDPTSRQYNEWVHGKPNAKSYEIMRRHDILYEYGIVVGYNMRRIPYKGSAIFIHEWRSPNSATAGCIAISRSSIISLLKWLNPKEHPEVEIRIN